jgi:hypothetical protein
MSFLLTFASAIPFSAEKEACGPEARKDPIGKMVTHRFPLEKAERAVRFVGGKFGGEEAIG